MAIVQLSRIQLRRGVAPVPQLASGELGWSINTQELFIGNGSVSEGSPYVGNTKVLTEHDDIFALANGYSYKPTNNLWGSVTPVARSLQERLDETVSIAAFGADGDSSDQTLAIQGAVDKLYLSDETTDRVILWFPPGIYTLSASIKLPPYVTIRGSGKDKTFFVTSTSNAFETVNGDSTPGSYNLTGTTNLYAPNGNQARYLDLADFTILVNGYNTAIKLDDCANSRFSNIKLQGTWTTGMTEAALCGITLSSSGIATCQNNVFNNIEIDGFHFPVYSDYDIKDNVWSECLFRMNKFGVAFGDETVIGTAGQNTGPLHNIIENCKFDMIDRQAIYIENGEYNLSSNNKFYNVGNDGGAPDLATYANITLGSYTNRSENDWFERAALLVGNGPADTYRLDQYVPEVEGRVFWNNTYAMELNVGNQPGPGTQTLLKFPAVDSGSIILDYLYDEASNGITREGTIKITMGMFGSGTVSITDEYEFIGDTALSSALQFSANAIDYGSALGNETISLNYINTASVSTDSLKFTVRYKS